MEKDTKKKFWLGFLITFLVTLFLALIIFGFKVLENVGLEKSWDYEIFENLINSLTVSGGLGVLIYFLTVFSDEGAFDAISYSAKLVWFTTFHKNIRETALPKTYAEYKEMKRGHKPERKSFLLYGSLINLVAGIIIMIPYYIIIR